MVGKGSAKTGERRATARRLAARPPADAPSLHRDDTASASGWGPATEDQLAQTYFQTRSTPPVVTVPRRRSPLLVAGVSLFTCVVGLLVVLGPPHRLAAPFGHGNHPVMAPVDFTETFDQPLVRPNVGVWLGHPTDTTQGCRVSYTELHRVGATGYGLVVDYDVDSPHPATAGVWIALPPVQVTTGSVLTFFIRGDPVVGYSETCAVEFQSAREHSRHYFDGITDAWQQIVLPLDTVRVATDDASPTYLVFLFEDWHVTRKRGRVYLDNVQIVRRQSS